MAPGSARRGERGFTYIGVLFGIAFLGLGLAVAGQMWTAQAKRERTKQLAWVGEQYRRAIGRYYDSSPGTVKRYPARLEDLLEDHRYLTVQRHLRQLYVNPMTAQLDWELVTAPGGGIAGIQTTGSDEAGHVVFRYIPTSQH